MLHFTFSSFICKKRFLFQLLDWVHGKCSIILTQDKTWALQRNSRHLCWIKLIETYKVSWYKNSQTNFLWILSWQNYHLFYLLSNLVCCAQLLFILRYVFFEFFYNKNDLLNKWKQLDSKELTECQDHRALV